MVQMETLVTPATSRTLVAAAAGLAMLVAVTAPSPAQDTVPGADFPSAAQVGAAMNGADTWTRSLGRPGFVALGAKPAACRSDVPFADASESRKGYYEGGMSRKNPYYGFVEVTVHRFASAGAAKRALKGLPTWLADCARSVEWVCKQCDGIATIRRTPAAQRRVGTQSVTWNQHSVGLGVANGRAVAARTGATVVVTVASHAIGPDSLQTPPRPPWGRGLSVARTALARAAG
jgi:hypothetical protein